MSDTSRGLLSSLRWFPSTVSLLSLITVPKHFAFSPDMILYAVFVATCVAGDVGIPRQSWSRVNASLCAASAVWVTWENLGSTLESTGSAFLIGIACSLSVLRSIEARG